MANEPEPPDVSSSKPRDTDEPASDREPESREEARQRRRLEGVIPDLVRRTFYAGLGAVFTTEEGIRKIAQDFHLPKDVANYLIQQAASSKDELFRIFAKELQRFFENVNLSGELQKLLTSLSFEVKTEIRFIPNDEAIGGVKPNIKRDVSVKRDKDDKKNKKGAAREDGGENE